MMPLVLMQADDTVFVTQLMHISRIMRVVRVVRLLNKIYKIDESDLSSVSRQMFTIGLTILTLVLVTSGVILTFEKPKRQELIKLNTANQCSRGYQSATFHEMFYFVVVTLATVGYGDVTPYSEEGRVCVIMFILFVNQLIASQLCTTDPVLVFIYLINFASPTAINLLTIATTYSKVGDDMAKLLIVQYVCYICLLPLLLNLFLSHYM